MSTRQPLRSSPSLPTVPYMLPLFAYIVWVMLPQAGDERS